LCDAAEYIQRLPKSEQHKPHWQLATETLINTAEGRDLLFDARVAMTRALTHDKPAPDPARRTKPSKPVIIIG
jgi:hypothetical protein